MIYALEPLANPVFAAAPYDMTVTEIGLTASVRRLPGLTFSSTYFTCLTLPPRCAACRRLDPESWPAMTHTEIGLATSLLQPPFQHPTIPFNARGAPDCVATGDPCRAAVATLADLA